MIKKRAKMQPGPAEREALRAREALEVLRRRTERPVCALRLSQGPVTVFDSHIGGLPYCPRKGEPPVGEDGRQLRLMVQINFAQMPGMPPFPKRGILQFFLPDHDWGMKGYRGMEHWTEQKNWRVLYHPEIDPSVTEDEVQRKVTVGPAVAEGAGSGGWSALCFCTTGPISSTLSRSYRRGSLWTTFASGRSFWRSGEAASLSRRRCSSGLSGSGSRESPCLWTSSGRMRSGRS